MSKQFRITARLYAEDEKNLFAIRKHLKKIGHGPLGNSEVVRYALQICREQVRHADGGTCTLNLSRFMKDDEANV